MTFVNAKQLHNHADRVFETLHKQRCVVVRHKGEPVSIIIEQAPGESEANIQARFQAAKETLAKGKHVSLFVIRP